MSVLNIIATVLFYLMLFGILSLLWLNLRTAVRNANAAETSAKAAEASARAAETSAKAAQQAAEAVQKMIPLTRKSP